MDRVNSVQELIERTKGMPLDRMRFFINQDRTDPRCFGIYHDDVADRWVVYKNKDNGTRAIRYSGPDEGYAANELWMKIQSEIGIRRAQQASQDPKAKRRMMLIVGITIALFIALTVGMIIYEWHQPSRGYYYVNDDLYYYQDSDWYWYDGGYWTTYDAPDGDWYGDGYYGETYAFDDARDAFEYSDYYKESDSGSDSGVFDNWDSGDTDWGSDW